MAATGLWVKVGAALPRHYKTAKLAEQLAIPVHECVGKLVCLWIYCVEFANEGVLTLEDFRRAFFAADEPQDTAAVEFALRALCDCGMPSHAGFLDDITPQGATSDDERRYMVHDWTAYSGTYRPDITDDARALSSIRRRKEKREKTTKEQNAPTVTPATSAASAPKVTAQESKSAPSVLPTVAQPLAHNAGDNFRNVADVFSSILSKYNVK